jgi:multidrug efflux pump subunit AcrA (membrane-fusion protein)
MNKLERFPTPDNGPQTPPLPADRAPGKVTWQAKSRTGRLDFLMLALALLIGSLGIGSWNHYSLSAEVMATAEQQRDFVPSMRTAQVRASGSTMPMSWPGTTEAFEQANIYGRASGYISKRNVDIGSRVKAGDLLAEITAPELDHQIGQAEGTLAQTPSLIVPAEAIVFNREGLSVAVVENGVAHMRQVTVVRDLGTAVEVNTGAKEGDQVILNPPVDLTDGRKVQFRAVPPAQLS